MRDAAQIRRDEEHRQRLSEMRLIWRMAKFGRGPDTSAETTLETIANFAEIRIQRIEALADSYGDNRP